MKKAFCSLFSIVLAATFVIFPIQSFASEIDVEPEYIDFASSVLEKYYRNKDLREENDFSADVSPDTKLLLDTKIELGQMQNDILKLSYDNYELDIQPISPEKWRNSQEEVYLQLQVIRTWNYNGFTSITTMSEVEEITISKGDNPIILSCYDLYINETLGPVDDIFRDPSASRNSLESRIDEYKQDYENQNIQKRKQMDLDLIASKSIDKETTTRGQTPIYGTDSRDWARANYNKNQPVSSDPDVPYYDFSEITNSYDCTNFVSHALLAGGATMHDDGAEGLADYTEWYFRDIKNRSTAWSGVRELYQFLTRSNPSSSNVGPFATELPLTYDDAYLGNIVQCKNGTRWQHSTIVTKFENGAVLVTGRTGDGQYNDNQIATTIYDDQRLLQITANYK